MSSLRQSANPDKSPKKPENNKKQAEVDKSEAQVDYESDGNYTLSSHFPAPYKDHGVHSSDYARTPRTYPPIPSLASRPYKSDPSCRVADTAYPLSIPQPRVTQPYNDEQYSTSADVREAGTWMVVGANHPRRLHIPNDQSNQGGQDSDSDTQATRRRRRRFKAQQSMLSQEHIHPWKDKTKSEGTNGFTEYEPRYPFESDDESQGTQSTALTEEERSGRQYGGRGY